MSYRIDNGDALLQETWDAMLRDESQEQDIYTGLTGTYSEDERGQGQMADGIIQRVTLKPGATEHTMGLLLDLTGAGVIGAGKTLRGSLESADTRFFTAYANDVRHGVENELFGLYAHRNIPYRILEKTMNKSNGLLAKWRKARRGRYIRQSAHQGYSDNLVETPTSRTLRWNRHILVKNVAQATQPVYDSTLATYESEIVTALSSAGVSTAASLDAGFFTVLNYYITNLWKIEPMDNGKYIVTIPARQAVYLKDLSDTSSLSRIQAGTFSEKIAGLTFQQVLGEIGNLILVVDDRAPILAWNTSSNVLTAAYRDVGSTDDRDDYSNDGTTRVFDAIIVHGKASITEAVAMAPRYDTQLEDIGRVEEVGMSETVGFQVTEYDADTATDSTRIGQNCGIAYAYSGSITP